MKYFKNPGRGPTRKKRRTAKQQAATRKMLAANRARRRGTSTKRRSTPTASTRRRTTTTARRGRTMKAKKRGARRRSSARRRSKNITLRRVSGKVYRSNPPILKAITGGLKDAAFVKAGAIAGTMVSDMVPVTGLGKTAVRAAVAGLMVFLPVGADSRRFLVAGAMQPVLDDLLQAAGVSKMLPASAGGVASYPAGMAAYLGGGGSEGEYAGEDAVGAYVEY